MKGLRDGRNGTKGSVCATVPGMGVMVAVTIVSESRLPYLKHSSAVRGPNYLIE